MKYGFIPRDDNDQLPIDNFKPKFLKMINLIIDSDPINVDISGSSENDQNIKNDNEKDANEKSNKKIKIPKKTIIDKWLKDYPTFTYDSELNSIKCFACIKYLERNLFVPENCKTFIAGTTRLKIDTLKNHLTADYHLIAVKIKHKPKEIDPIVRSNKQTYIQTYIRT